MKKRYRTLKGTQLILSESPLATPGGEGAVFSIEAPEEYKSFCAKVYYKKFKDSTRRDKLTYMVSHKPEKLYSQGYKICWPSELILNDEGEFEGFVMPLAFENSISPYFLCKTRISPDLPKIWHEKYDRSALEGVKSTVQALCKYSHCHSSDSFDEEVCFSGYETPKHVSYA